MFSSVCIYIEDIEEKYFIPVFVWLLYQEEFTIGGTVDFFLVWNLRDWLHPLASYMWY